MKHIFLLHDIKKHHQFASAIPQIMDGYDYEIIYSSSLQRNVRYISNYATPARFYAVGGDGTVSGLVQAIVHTAHELVVIPLGTGNDFCRMLTKDVDPKKVLASSLLLDAKKVDTILMNETYYVNAACFGLDSIIANHVQDNDKVPLLPKQSYLVSLLKKVVHYKPCPIKIMSEDICLYQGDMILGTINNAQYYGGGFQITPQAKINDGWMDICIVDHVPKTKIPYMLQKLLRKNLRPHPKVHDYRVKSASVICENPANIDGEQHHAETYFFQIQPASLNLVYDEIEETT